MESLRLILCTVKMCLLEHNTQHTTAVYDLGHLLNSSLLQQMAYLVTTGL